MSSNENARDQQVVGLREFVASTRRSVALDEFHWVFVDNTDAVVAAFVDFPPVIKTFFERLAADPVAALDLRIYTIDRDRVELYWPDGLSPLERARRLFDSNALVELGPVCVEFFHEYLLCAEPGEIHVGDRTHRLFELWWPDQQGERQVIGYAIQSDADSGGAPARWQLWTIRGTHGIEPDVIEAGLANDLNTLVEAATSIGERFGLLERHGEESI